ncbi:MAG: SRPBCC family protein [Sphingomonadales bacterium]
MSKERLIEIVRDNIAHAKAGTMAMAPGVYKVPASAYTDEARFKREIDLIFKRMPLMLAPSAEVPNPGDYKAMTPFGTPVLITRGKDGKARAFMNACGHRGAPLRDCGTGKATRFVCPYHGWTYNNEGKLVGVAASSEFGEFDRDEYGLPALPTYEKAGLIWAILDPKSTVDIAASLSGYDDMLAHFNFDNWYLFDSRTLRGPNWKIAYDGYLDFYHLPVLHKTTIGGDRSPQANYYDWGPHQRVTSPDRYLHLDKIPEDQWPMEDVMTGVWTIFPHISIASFKGGGRGAMISQLFPGSTVGESFTTQYYMMEKEPDQAGKDGARKQFDLLENVVRDEDYKTGLQVQESLSSGARNHSLFGRNEWGGQRFHGWVQRLLETPDDQLNALFSKPERQAAE